MDVDEYCGSNSDWSALKELEGTAPMKILNLRWFKHKPPALEALVRWPKELQSLIFNPVPVYQIHRPGVFPGWTLKHLQPILKIQMANLRDLTIDEWECMEDADAGNLDLRGFTMLERLRLPTSLTGCDTRYIPRIIPPNLRYFRWKMIYDHGEIVLGNQHKKWLSTLTKSAAKERQKLNTIFVALDFEDLYILLNHTVIYPWDALDDIDKESKRFGLRVRYNEPFVTREEVEKARISRRLWLNEEPDSDEDPTERMYQFDREWLW
ncbi:unnamed protein product [Fusarium equiseti]|uniref:Uncharacterized protein n=1 Tax=Fusarium equiseti TaxID=61235 RepID=A0A8J2IGE9_FUSEQ|nr:unnamed protein product [Fusarium equiseti]